MLTEIILDMGDLGYAITGMKTEKGVVQHTLNRS